MKCRECELLLADGAVDASVEDHLRTCAACRAFQEEVHANVTVLSSLREEELPALNVPRPSRSFPWMSVAAAAVALAVVVPGIWQATRPVPPPQVKAKIPDEVTVSAEAEPETEALTVKMLTPDPNVVIYWLIDSKQGE